MSLTTLNHIPYLPLEIFSRIINERSQLMTRNNVYEYILKDLSWIYEVTQLEAIENNENYDELRARDLLSNMCFTNLAVGLEPQDLHCLGARNDKWIRETSHY